MWGKNGPILASPPFTVIIWERPGERVASVNTEVAPEVAVEPVHQLCFQQQVLIAGDLGWPLCSHQANPF